MCTQVSHLYPAAKYVLPKLLLGPIYHFIYYGDVLKVGGQRFCFVCCFQTTKDTPRSVVVCGHLLQYCALLFISGAHSDQRGRQRQVSTTAGVWPTEHSHFKIRTQIGQCQSAQEEARVRLAHYCIGVHRKL